MPVRMSKGQAIVREPALGDKIKSAGLKVNKPKQQPVWDGPCDGGPRGGITQSIISRWLCCRERARLRFMEGMTTADSFQARIEYGEMFHCAEEAFAKGPTMVNGWCPAIEKVVMDYARELCSLYPTQQQQVLHWVNVLRQQFPVYVKYWAGQPDVKNRTPLSQEQVFHVPYLLPSGRTVYLRGKYDGVDIIGSGKQAGVFLFETKTKGDIKEDQMRRQLAWDLQTGFYMTSLQKDDSWRVGPAAKVPLLGLRYNVIRRPLSGGAGTIRQLKPSKSNPLGETDAQFYQRLGQVISEEAEAAVKEKRDCAFFFRWKVLYSSEDIRRFEQMFLIPLFEEICDWYDWVSTGDPWREGNRLHHMAPMGVYNPLMLGGVSDLDEYITTGSTIGLQTGVPLFRELQ